MRFRGFSFADRTAIISRLRERDGDDCRICQTAIDFTIAEEGNPGVATIDHVRPFGEGGDAGDIGRLENLQLAHSCCNGLRAKFVEPEPQWYARALLRALAEWPKPAQRERREARKRRRGLS